MTAEVADRTRRDRTRTVLIAIVALGFLLRLGAGLYRGPHFVDNGYAFYAAIAETWWSGNGFCTAPAENCADRMPGYPLLVAPFVANGLEYPWLIVLQAALGAVQPLLAFLIGRELFNQRAGLIAASLEAFNPYAIIHGAAFQDTVVVNLLVASAALLLIRAIKKESIPIGLAAGLLLAVTVLTTARIVFLVVLLLAWVGLGGGLRNHGRHRLAAWVALPLVLLVGLWLARNQRVVGAPVLTTEAGLSLWIAHSDSMMALYPNRSVDEVAQFAWQRLSPEWQAALAAADADPVREDRLYARRAWLDIRENPLRASRDAALRVLYAFSGWLSPARDWPIQLGYAVLFLPLNLMGLAALWRAARRDAIHLLMVQVFASVALTAAVFWVHTSHQSYLDVFRIVYAASMIALVAERADAARHRALH